MKDVSADGFNNTGLAKKKKKQDSHTSSVRQTNRPLLMKHGWNNTRAQRKCWAQAIIPSTFSLVEQLL